MKKFEFKKSFEVIDIAGKEYKVGLKDEQRKQYSEQLNKFYQIAEKAKQTDENKLTLETAQQLEDEMKVVTLDTLDALFGSGSGEELYEAADHQTEELIPIVFSVAEIINERREEKFGKYTKKRKGK
jgi:hypothetical protein